jgi:hypothetical protein
MSRGKPSGKPKGRPQQETDRTPPAPPGINEININVYPDPPDAQGRRMFEMQWWGYDAKKGRETLRAQFYRSDPNEWIKKFRNAGRVVRVYGWPR